MAEPKGKQKKKKKRKSIESEFTTEENFAKDAKTIFTLLEDQESFSLGVDLEHPDQKVSSLEVVDLEWKIPPPDHRGHRWRGYEVESVLSALVSRQTPNVKETKLSLYRIELGECISRRSPELWKLLPKLNNLTYLNMGNNGLSDVSPLIRRLIHLQELDLSLNRISAEGVGSVCQLIKVCDCGGYFQKILSKR